MNADDVLLAIFSGFLSYGIPLLFWIGTLIFGVIMLRRSGGRPERFFITGVALNILGTILRIPLNYLFGWLHHGDLEESMIESVNFSAGLVVNVIGATGILCLIYAFWLKFKKERTDESVFVEAES